MARKEKNTLNEDVDLLNDEDKASETPSTLVAESPDSTHPGELSPNPAHFGFTSQRIVNSLPASGDLNVLYIVPIKNAGNIIGYRKWTWDLEKGAWRRVYGSIANLKLSDGGRSTPTNVVNTPKEGTKVFNEKVLLNGLVLYKGKELNNLSLADIPAGGTKLYQHKISVGTKSFSLICTTNHQFVKSNIGFDVISVAGNRIVGVGYENYNGTEIYPIIRAMSTVFLVYYLDVSGSDVVITALDLSGTLTDTVTEL